MQKYAYKCDFDGEPGFYEMQIESGRLMVEQWTPKADQDTQIIPYEQYELLKGQVQALHRHRSLADQMRDAENNAKESRGQEKDRPRTFGRSL